MADRIGTLGLWWFVSLGVTGLLLLFIVLPPYVGPGWRLMIMQSFSPVCHQIAQRSFMVDGVAFAVCHRCFGIFVGLFVGLAAYLLARRWEDLWWGKSRMLMLGALLPLALDWLLGVSRLWNNTPGSRTATGLLFGLVAGLMLAQALCAIASPTVPAAESSSTF